MSPKTTTITKYQLLDAAWQLVQEAGGESLTARNLAKRLGSSTMPIYSSAGSMGELAGELRTRIAAALTDYQARTWSKNRMLDAAVGYVMFARDEPRLFKFLWSRRIEEGPAKMTLEEVIASATGRGSAIPPPGTAEALEGINIGERDPFIFHTWVFIHGIASLVSEGLFAPDDDDLIRHLEAAGAAFWLFHASAKEAQS